MTPDRSPGGDTLRDGPPRRRATGRLLPVLAGLLVLNAALVCAALAYAYSSAQEGASLEQRRAYVAGLSAAEKEELSHKQERFAALPPEEQERLRQLHAELVGAADGPRLQLVLTRYHEWLKTLSTGERAELLDLPAEERIARIAHLRQQEEWQEFRRLIEADRASLPQEDINRIFDWVNEFLKAHQDEIIADLPEDRRRWFSRLDSPEQRLRLMLFYILRHPEIAQQHMLSDEGQESVQQLIDSLSPPTRDQLQSQEDPTQKRELLRRWVWAAVISRTFPDRASPEELEEFFSNLPQAQRERLESLPRDQMQQQLRRLYYQRQFGSRGRNGHDHRHRPPPERGEDDFPHGPRHGPPGPGGDEPPPPEGPPPGPDLPPPPLEP